jgi:hypothetical protein
LVVVVQKLHEDAYSHGWSLARRSLGDETTRWLLFWRSLAFERDLLVGAVLVLAAFALYAATLLPGIGSRDTAEFQRVVPTLGLAHPTGYPLYTILGWLWVQLPLGGTPAWRLNLFSAAAAALAVGVIYLVARAIGQRRSIAAAVALALAASRAFWSQATLAEVYGLAALLQALLLLALLRWRAGHNPDPSLRQDSKARGWPFWIIGLLVGLGLAHHRAIVLMLPGALLFVGHTIWNVRRGNSREGQPTSSNSQSPTSISQIGLAMLAAAAGCLLYLYVPLRAPAWMQTWPQVWEHISGSALTATWLDLARLRAEGFARVLDLAARFVWPQLLPFGAVLALLGAGRILWRDRALAALLLGGYTTIFVFCAGYYVADVEVFLIGAHLIAALLLGEGAMLLAVPAKGHPRTTNGGRRASLGSNGLAVVLWSSVVSRWSSIVSFALLAVPALLFSRNLQDIQALNTADPEHAARAIMAQPLAPGALVIGDWSASEALRYLQAVEGARPDIQFVDAAPPATIHEAVAHGRAVYLSHPDLSLGLIQVPEGRFWRVGQEPLRAVEPADIRWGAGISLAGYTLAGGPYQPDAAVPIVLEWRAREALSRDFTLFVHLIAEDGTIWGQHDQAPTIAPTSRWQPGASYVELFCPRLPPDAPPGRYRVNIGWYEYPSLRRLALMGAAGDYLTLGDIEVGAAR